MVTHQPPLYVFGGFKTAAEFFSECMKEDPRTASRYMRVAKYATPIEEEKYGVRKLDAAIAYLEAKHGPPSGALPVAFDRVKVPAKTNGTLKRIALEAATIEQIDRATRAEQKGGDRGLRSPVEAAIEKALRANKALKKIRVRASARAVSFAGVPAERLPDFAKALLAVKVPPAAAPVGRKPSP